MRANEDANDTESLGTAEILESSNQSQARPDLGGGFKPTDESYSEGPCRRVRLDRSKRLLAWRLIAEVRTASEPVPPAHPLPPPVKEPPGNERDVPEVPYKDPDPAEPGEI